MLVGLTQTIRHTIPLIGGWNTSESLLLLTINTPWFLEAPPPRAPGTPEVNYGSEGGKNPLRRPLIFPHISDLTRSIYGVGGKEGNGIFSHP